MTQAEGHQSLPDRRFLPQMAIPLASLDAELSPSLSAKDAAGALERMVSDTAAALHSDNTRCSANIPYGAAPRQKLDIFRPDAPLQDRLPCFVFLHGGFWQEGDKSVSGFAAQTFTQMGWCYVSVGYTLAPQATLTGIAEEIAAALNHLVAHAGDYGIDAQRIVLAGHSAGGHLAACAVAGCLGDDVAGHLSGAVLISGVFELAPVARSYVNDVARITQRELRALSPARHRPAVQVPVHLLVGADEPEAFLTQTRVLSDLWADGLPDLTLEIAPGRDHFDILDELKTPGSPALRRISGMA